MGKHTRTGHRSTGVAAAVAAGRPLRGRRRHAAPSAGTARRIAAPATLAALLLTTGATTGTAFAGTGSDDGSSGTSADCPDGSTPVGGSCSGDSSGSESSSGSSGGLGDLVTGADVVGSVLGAGGSGSGSSGGDSSDQGSGTTSETSGKDSGGKDSGGEDSGGEDSGGEDSGGDDSAGKDSAGKDSAGKDSAGKDSAGKDSGGSDSAAPAAGTKDSGSPSTGPLDAVPGLGDLTGGLGKGVDLNTPTKPLTSLPDPAQTLSDAGTSVPGAGQAGSLVDTAVGAAGTVVGTDTGNSPLAGPTDTLTGLGDVVPDLPSVPGVTDGSTDELPDVPGLTAGGPLEGLNEIAGLPDTTPLTGRDGPLPDLSGVARTAGLPDYSGLGGLPDVAGVVGGPSTGPTQVDLASKNTDGVAGTATVDSDTVSGTATGMDPDARYVSFFYGATSSATNNNPCILDGTNPLPGGQTVGEWEVDENGNGTLEAPNPSGNMYKLTGGTMSIRKVEHGFDKATAPPVNPLSYSLSSCGAMERISTADPVTDAVPKLPTANVPGTPYVSGPGLQD
ncbi:hypothetical protein [Pseudonocardia alni]|uniref:Uncharacterized protein n=1 Tax=Pseudonocardia alni TaxID=33907 RepID=A0A852W6H4_PSEA5|nr:hypothetical protein [Pseudonocardia antarctica]NYG04543.1 hypothetical protein [Pseudonocardia antarctica]